MLTWRGADMADVHAVFADLSDISAVEIISDVGSWWNALPTVQKILVIPDAQTEALVDETNTALAIFGHYPGEGLLRTTWFVFSRGFQHRGAASMLACRNRLKTLRLFYPDTYFHSFTMSDHLERVRWFALLGFHYTGTTANGEHHYVLLPKDTHKLSDSGAVERYNPTNPRAS